MENNLSPWAWLDEEMAALPGKVSCYFRNLATGETYSFQEEEIHPSASVIKIYLMAYVQHLIGEGILSPLDPVPVNREGMAESSGVLYYLKDLREMSVRDLVELMIIVSDNSATNILLDLVGMENLQSYLRESLGLAATQFQRRMMDFDAVQRGCQNYTSAKETGEILEKIYRGTLVSPEASAEMLKVLKEQQFNDLIPFYLDEFIPEHSIAHKTGGLENVVHDAAIIDYGKAPFILCFFGSGTEVPVLSRFMGEAAARIYRQVQET